MIIYGIYAIYIISCVNSLKRRRWFFNKLSLSKDIEVVPASPHGGWVKYGWGVLKISFGTRTIIFTLFHSALTVLWILDRRFRCKIPYWGARHFKLHFPSILFHYIRPGHNLFVYWYWRIRAGSLSPQGMKRICHEIDPFCSLQSSVYPIRSFWFNYI